MDNCTSDGYGNQGCIGTAVSTHGAVEGPGGLPYTGFEVWWLVLAALAVIALGAFAAAYGRH